MKTVRVPCQTHGIPRDDPWHDLNVDVPVDAVVLVWRRPPGMPLPVLHAQALCGAHGDPDSRETADTGQLHAVRWNVDPDEAKWLRGEGVPLVMTDAAELLLTLGAPGDDPDLADRVLTEVAARPDAVGQLKALRMAHCRAWADRLTEIVANDPDGLDSATAQDMAEGGLAFRARLTDLAKAKRRRS